MIARLADLVQIQAGYQHAGSIMAEPEGPFAIIQARDISDDGDLDTANLTRITLRSRPQRYLVEAGDVLFLAKGARGNPAVLIREPLLHTVAAGTFQILRTRTPELMPEYLAWFLNQTPAQQHFAKNARGALVMLVSRNVLEDLEVNVPSLGVQRAVVALDDTARRERALTLELLQRRELLARETALRAIRQGD